MRVPPDQIAFLAIAQSPKDKRRRVAVFVGVRAAGPGESPPWRVRFGVAKRVEQSFSTGVASRRFSSWKLRHQSVHITDYYIHFSNIELEKVPLQNNSCQCFLLFSCLGRAERTAVAHGLQAEGNIFRACSCIVLLLSNLIRSALGCRSSLALPQ
ncbi:hypothetical protein [Pseudomonas rubra]|uniref:Uncharacterized protein n=1 Tax=Pseudomonas rubra TaxID=2942627 RepID=A0ABT5PA55_9PSED|nr:hypothetical protein [Pseudomonas rubra]MDD1015189.1 hypothetical protein [Pseudomonas rubra]MDD1037843.1 hypothetical protein [Pseudomonas rubra]MDD1152828.1 hypothetical protein [Pseudomonas rubra]